MRIEILMFDGVDELDVFGPFEAFGVPGLETALVAPGGPGTVTTNRGIEVAVTAPAGAHVLVAPGGGWLNRAEHGTWAEVQRGTIPAHLREHAAGGGAVASVCTGAFLLGAAGLLEGRDATTNSAALPDLERYAGRVLRQRVVDAWPVVTAMGPATGLELGLHLVRRLLGDEVADARTRGVDALLDAAARFDAPVR